MASSSDNNGFGIDSYWNRPASRGRSKRTSRSISPNHKVSNERLEPPAREPDAHLRQPDESKKSPKFINMSTPQEIPDFKMKALRINSPQQHTRFNRENQMSPTCLALQSQYMTD
jgi:hypothetical protein